MNLNHDMRHENSLQALLKELVHFFEEALLVPSGTGLEVLRIPEAFEYFPLFFGELLWCPNVNIYQKITGSVSIYTWKPLSAQSQQLTGLGTLIYLDFGFAGECWHLSS